MKWQPIETAPVGQEVMLLLSTGETTQAILCSPAPIEIDPEQGEYWMVDVSFVENLDYEIKAWAETEPPLPDPPKEGE